MKEVVVISGKGGTGKTSLVASFAALAATRDGIPAAGAARSVPGTVGIPTGTTGGAAPGPVDLVLADCDVDAPDLHLLLQPEVKETHDFRASRKAAIDLDKCTECGLCAAHCRFNAIDGTTVDPLSCEGCGVCFHICPTGAITMRDELSGRWYVSETRYGPMVHALMEPGEENSGRLVSLVRRQARQLAEERGADLLITDGPPGIGCPVISSISGADLAVVVTEPSVSGMHDLARVLGVCRHFGVPSLVCINRYDLHPEGAEAIKQECTEQGIEVAGYIPYDPVATRAIVQGKSIVEFTDGEISRAIQGVWGHVTKVMFMGS